MAETSSNRLFIMFTVPIRLRKSINFPTSTRIVYAGLPDGIKKKKNIKFHV